MNNDFSSFWNWRPVFFFGTNISLDFCLQRFFIFIVFREKVDCLTVIYSRISDAFYRFDTKLTMCSTVKWSCRIRRYALILGFHYDVQMGARCLVAQLKKASSAFKLFHQWTKVIKVMPATSYTLLNITYIVSC